MHDTCHTISRVCYSSNQESYMYTSNIYIIVYPNCCNLIRQEALSYGILRHQNQENYESYCHEMTIKIYANIKHVCELSRLGRAHHVEWCTNDITLSLSNSSSWWELKGVTQSYSVAAPLMQVPTQEWADNIAFNSKTYETCKIVRIR